MIFDINTLLLFLFLLLSQSPFPVDCNNHPCHYIPLVVVIGHHLSSWTQYELSTLPMASIYIYIYILCVSNLLELKYYGTYYCNPFEVCNSYRRVSFIIAGNFYLLKNIFLKIRWLWCGQYSQSVRTMRCDIDDIDDNISTAVSRWLSQTMTILVLTWSSKIGCWMKRINGFGWLQLCWFSLLAQTFRRTDAEWVIRE